MAPPDFFGHLFGSFVLSDGTPVPEEFLLFCWNSWLEWARHEYPSVHDFNPAGVAIYRACLGMRDLFAHGHDINMICLPAIKDPASGLTLARDRLAQNLLEDGRVNGCGLRQDSCPSCWPASPSSSDSSCDDLSWSDVTVQPSEPLCHTPDIYTTADQLADLGDEVACQHIALTAGDLRFFGLASILPWV